MTGMNFSKEQMAIMGDIIAHAVKTGIEQYENDRFITRTEVAELLRCDPRTISNYLKEGLLTQYKVSTNSVGLYKKGEVLSLPRAKKAARAKLKAA